MQACNGEIPLVPLDPPPLSVKPRDFYIPEIVTPPCKKIRIIAPKPPRFEIGFNSYKNPFTKAWGTNRRNYRSLRLVIPKAYQGIIN